MLSPIMVSYPKLFLIWLTCCPLSVAFVSPAPAAGGSFSWQPPSASTASVKHLREAGVEGRPLGDQVRGLMLSGLFAGIAVSAVSSIARRKGGVLARSRGSSRVIALGASTSRSGLRAVDVQVREGPPKTALQEQHPAHSRELAPKGEIDTVERVMGLFVPKIAEFKRQAELLRNRELRNMLDTMEDLGKTDLLRVFSEVDDLLATLISAIDGLKDSAINIRRQEVLEEIEQLERGEHPADGVNGLDEEMLHDINQPVETMTEVHVIGLSHHKAPVEIREKLAVAEAEWNRYAKELVEFARTPNGHMVPEVAVISTCNRFELYFSSPEMLQFSARQAVGAFLRQKSGLTREELDPYLFTYSGEKAINHLFEVSSGLDSLVLGEAQILAQVKSCHEHSIQKAHENVVEGSGGKIVSKMLNAAIRMGKTVRTKTDIGKGSVSVSSAAVELMLAKVMPDLQKVPANAKVCILGAGKMSRLLLLALFSKLPDIEVTVVNRSVDKAQELLDDEMVRGRGGKNAKVAKLEDMLDVVRESDVVFAATASKDPILSAKDLQNREQGVMLVDISVPRNIAKDCSEVPNVFSYSVDDLKKVVEANAEKRQSEVVKARELIESEVKRFKTWQASQGAVPYLTALQKMADGIRNAEAEKAAKRLKALEGKEKQAVEKMTRHIVDQIFRPIYYSMKDDEEVEAKRNKISALRDMFNLEPVYKRRRQPSTQTAALPEDRA